MERKEEETHGQICVGLVDGVHHEVDLTTVGRTAVESGKEERALGVSFPPFSTRLARPSTVERIARREGTH